jgi:3-hydroxyisobutyrate dehydrogenase/2-hydroxy-3-oxopropionate reductase
MSLHQKDLGIALDAAGDVNLDLPVTQLVADLENGLMEQGHGDEDVSALHRYYGTKS